MSLTITCALLHFFFGQGNGFLEDRQTLVHLGLGDAQRRGNAHDALAAAKQDEAAFEGKVNDLRAKFLGRDLAPAVLDELHADHQADAAHVTDGGMARHDLVQGVEGVLPDGGGIFQVLIFDQVDGGKGSRAGHGVAAKGVAVRTARPGHDGITGDADTHGHAGGDALGNGDDIRFDVKMLDRPPLAGASHAALDFVGDEQDVVLVAQFAQGGEEPGGRNDVAALALDGLDQDAGNLIGREDVTEDLVFNIANDRLAVVLTGQPVQDGTVGIREGGVDHAVHERIKAAVVSGLAGGEGDRAHGASVESAGKADEIGAPAVVTGKLDGGLDRLGTRVSHEGGGVLCKRGDLVELFPQGDPFFVIKVRRNMNELLSLILDGFDHLRMAVTGGDDGDAGSKIEEAIPVHVPDLGALAVVHDEGDAAR